jgi:transcriptional regulator with XRE-family HTH domain
MANLLPGSEIYRAFGEQLGAARRRARLTQMQFAELVGLSRTSITNVECGRQSVLLHQLYKFADVLAVPVSSLMPVVSSLSTTTNLESDEYLKKLKAATPAVDDSSGDL